MFLVLAVYFGTSGYSGLGLQDILVTVVQDQVDIQVIVRLLLVQREPVVILDIWTRWNYRF